MSASPLYEEGSQGTEWLSHLSKRRGAWTLTPEPARVTAGHAASHFPGLTCAEVNGGPGLWVLFSGALRSLCLLCNLLHLDDQS